MRTIELPESVRCVNAESRGRGKHYEIPAHCTLQAQVVVKLVFPGGTVLPTPFCFACASRETGAHAPLSHPAAF